MKRSKSIRLVLIGSVAAGAVTSCSPGDPARATITPASVYTNNFHVPGVGYYHAPFRAWYPLPYNHYNQQTHRYFYGGQWDISPCQNITNISAPTPEIAAQAQAQRTDVVRRSGFGHSSRSHHTWS